jgi:hypothetical protein
MLIGLLFKLIFLPIRLVFFLLGGVFRLVFGLIGGLLGLLVRARRSRGCWRHR